MITIHIHWHNQVDVYPSRFGLRDILGDMLWLRTMRCRCGHEYEDYL
jgi:hypothetical protein